MFGAAGTGAASGGPCLLDPEAGSLFPRNWLRPRFHLQAGSHQDVFEIRLHADKEANDLVVYTTSPTWTMPGPIWNSLSANLVDQPITVSVRGLDSSTGKVAQGVSETITIAPVEAKGTIVYWTTSGGSALKGFSVGQENVVTVVTPPQTPGKCIGCHSSSPGGEFIGFSNSSDATNGDLAHIEIRSGTNPTQQPSFLTPSAQALLQRVSQELPVFSPAHWTAGDHVAVFMHSDTTDESGQNTHLLWVDLEAASQAQGVGWGEFARTGDPNAAAAYPFLSHDGQHIVYASAPSANPSGILTSGDLYTVDYGNRAGGTAQPVAGAATKQWSEFYPALSPDDAIIAYTRLPDGETSYDNPHSEIMLVDAKGGTPVRPTANDPGHVPGAHQPGRHEQLAQVVARRVDGQRADVLLDHLLVDAQREPAALHRGRHQGRGRAGHDHARAVPLEPAARREQPHAGLGHVPHPARLRASARAAEREVQARGDADLQGRGRSDRAQRHHGDVVSAREVFDVDARERGHRVAGPPRGELRAPAHVEARAG